MINLIPTNRHLLVEKVCESYKEEKLNDVKVLLPEDYSQEKPKEHTCYKVIDLPYDCELSVKPNDIVIAETYAVKEVSVLENTFLLVPQQNVIAIIRSR